MAIWETVMNAAFTGLGAGIGSYFGSKIAQKSEAHLKEMMKVRRK